MLFVYFFYQNKCGFYTSNSRDFFAKLLHIVFTWEFFSFNMMKSFKYGAVSKIPSCIVTLFKTHKVYDANKRIKTVPILL